jgi:hypothetical protein
VNVALNLSWGEICLLAVITEVKIETSWLLRVLIWSLQYVPRELNFAQGKEEGEEEKNEEKGEARRDPTAASPDTRTAGRNEARDGATSTYIY